MNKNRIDLRSDTVTLPPQEMRDAMSKAELGDDVYGEDPTVNLLQERCAQLTGKEAALFVPTGTMGNLSSVLAHCQRGDEVILGSRSHIAIWEQAGASAFGGVSLRTIANEADGTLPLEQISLCINDDNVHRTTTKLIALENTYNGQPLTPAYMRMVKENSPRADEALELLRWNGGNNSGIGIAAIDNEGNVHADQFWWHYSFGSVRTRSFGDIWTDTSDKLMALLKNRKPYLKGRCGKCRWLDICNGNFRVRAEAVYGDVLAPDPACYLPDEEIGIT